MKILKIFLISLFVLIILAIAGVAIFIATFDVNRYKPQMITQAKAALNRDIDFGKASLAFSFSKGISIRVTDVSIGEDPVFATGNFFTVKDVSLGVDVLGYLSRKRVDISDILIDTPRVTIIRQKDGTLNVTSLAKPAPEANKAAPALASAPETAPAAGTAACPAFLVSAIKVTNGSITYEDRSSDPAMSVEVADLTVRVDHLSLTEPFGFAAVGTVLFDKKKIKIEGKAQIDLKTSKVTIENVSAAVNDGTVKASGAIDGYLTTQNYDLTLNADNLKIQDFMSPEKAGVKVEGAISADFKVRGAGFTPEAVKSTMSGEGRVSGKSIKLKDINVLRLVLDKISMIPNLSQNVEAKLPEKYQQKLKQTDTAISDISLPVVIQNGRIVVKDMVISADEFIFQGRAEAGFDGSFSSEGSFLIPAELSAAMAAGVPQLQYLLNPDRQIYVPVKVSGQAPEMHVSVDIEYLARKLVQNQVETQLIKVIDKALGQKEPGSSASGQPATGAEEKKAAPEDLISGILGQVLSK